MKPLAAPLLSAGVARSARWSAALLLAWLALAGCKLKPPHNMEEQPKANPYKPSAFFPDGTTARPVPSGTVPRTLGGAETFAYDDVSRAIAGAGDSTATSAAIPFPITAELLERGHERFDIFCSVCHGRLGNGGGMIPQRGLTPPPSFHIQRLRDVSDAHIYNVISNGYGQMFSYDDQVSREDRWMIVAYIRALQASTSKENPRAALTDEDRRRLEGSRP